MRFAWLEFQAAQAVSLQRTKPSHPEDESFAVCFSLGSSAAHALDA